MEQIDRPFCPDPQVLGAFVEGTLARSEVTGVRDHLATCNDCLEDVSEAAEQLRMPQPRPRVWRLAAAAGVAIAVIGGGLWYRASISDPVNDLRSIKMSKRYLLPRLTGFPHAEPHIPRGGGERTTDNAIVELDRQIYSLRADLGDDNSAKARHARGVSYLIPPSEDHARNLKLAVQELAEAVAAAPKDPKIRNDYAAALYTTGNQTEALKQVRIALQQKPDFPEALFNHALILGDGKEAEAAWQRYLQVDPSSRWAEEARSHLSDLSQP